MDPVQLPRCNPPFQAGCTPLKLVLLGASAFRHLVRMLLKKNQHLSDSHITLSESSMALQIEISTATYQEIGCLVSSVSLTYSMQMFAIVGRHVLATLTRSKDKRTSPWRRKQLSLLEPTPTASTSSTQKTSMKNPGHAHPDNQLVEKLHGAGFQAWRSRISVPTYPCPASYNCARNMMTNPCYRKEAPRRS